jgi:hypothetical protein
MPQSQPAAASTPELGAVTAAILRIHTVRLRDTDHPASRAVYNVAIEKMLEVHNGLCSIRYRVEPILGNGRAVGYQAVDTWTGEQLSTHIPGTPGMDASLDIARTYAERGAKAWNASNVTDRTQDLLTALRNAR